MEDKWTVLFLVILTYPKRGSHMKIIALFFAKFFL